MALDLNTAFSRDGQIREAARNRIRESSDFEYSASELEQLVDAYLGVQFPAREPVLLGRTQFLGGELMTSPEQRTQLRDRKFLIEAMSRTVSEVERRIQRSGTTYSNQLSTLETSIAATAAAFSGNYFVKANWAATVGGAFNVFFSSSLAFDPDYLNVHDPRTGRKFLASEQLTNDHGQGPLLLPMIDRQEISLRTVEVDAGFTGVPIAEGFYEHNDPMTAITPGEVFRARFFVPFDSPEVPAFFLSPYLTLVIRFSSTQFFNRMDFDGFSNMGSLPIIQYFDGQDWETADVVWRPDANLNISVVHVNTVVTDRVRLIFWSLPHTEDSEVSRGERRNFELNKVLSESKWNTFLNDRAVDFRGRVVDFHINNISFALEVRGERGYAASYPKPVDGYMRRLVAAVDPLSIDRSGGDGGVGGDGGDGGGGGVGGVGGGDTGPQVTFSTFAWQASPIMSDSSLELGGRRFVAGNSETDTPGFASWSQAIISGKLYWEFEYDALDSPGGSSVDGAVVRMGITNSDADGESRDQDPTLQFWATGIDASDGMLYSNGFSSAVMGASSLVAGDRLAFAVNGNNGSVWVGLVGPGPAYTVTWWGSGTPDPATLTDQTYGQAGLDFRPFVADLDAAAQAYVTLHGSTTGLSTPPAGFTWLDEAEVSEGEGEGEEDVGLEVRTSEPYIEVDLKNSEGQQVVRDLIPIPSAVASPRSNSLETEVLVCTGNVGMLRFFPLLNYAETSFQQNIVVDHSPILPQVFTSDSGSPTIGVDYQVTVDGGETWLNDWPSSDFYGKVAMAGMAGIKFLNYNANATYIVAYYAAKQQWLNQGKDFLFRRNHVFASKALRRQRVNGTIRGVVIARALPDEYGMTGVQSFMFGAKYVNEQDSET